MILYMWRFQVYQNAFFYLSDNMNLSLAVLTLCAASITVVMGASLKPDCFVVCNSREITHDESAAAHCGCTHNNGHRKFTLSLIFADPVLF